METEGGIAWEEEEGGARGSRGEEGEGRREKGREG